MAHHVKDVKQGIYCFVASDGTSFTYGCVNLNKAIDKNWTRHVTLEGKVVESYVEKKLL
jgi:hypothetical protein